MLAAWEDALVDPYLKDATAPLQVVAEHCSGCTKYSPMTIHGYENEFDIVEDGSSWKWYEPCTMTKGAQQLANHMAQQVTRKVDPSYDGKTSFFAFEDATDDWCDITELEPEKRGPDSCFEEQTRRRCICLQRLLNRELLRDPTDGVNYLKRFLQPRFIKGAQTVFLYRFIQFMKHNKGTMGLK